MSRLTTLDITTQKSTLPITNSNFKQHSLLTQKLTLQYHPLFYALLEPAILAPIPLRLRYLTISIRHTRIHPPILHSSLEETLATLTGDYAVVETGCLVLADHADHGLFLFFCCLLKGRETNQKTKVWWRKAFAKDSVIVREENSRNGNK